MPGGASANVGRVRAGVMSPMPLERKSDKQIYLTKRDNGRYSIMKAPPLGTGKVWSPPRDVTGKAGNFSASSFISALLSLRGGGFL